MRAVWKLRYRSVTPCARWLASSRRVPRGAGAPARGVSLIFSKCWALAFATLELLLTLDLALEGVTNRWDGEAESQWIVAARLLYHLQYLVPYLSRLQRIHLPDRLKL